MFVHTILRCISINTVFRVCVLTVDPSIGPSHKATKLNKGAALSYKFCLF